jgi:hypothetical protein
MKVKHLDAARDDPGKQVIRSGHDRLAVEEDTYVIEFQCVRQAAKFWRVVDTHAILLAQFVAAYFPWLMSVDRHVEESPTSAA